MRPGLRNARLRQTATRRRPRFSPSIQRGALAFTLIELLVVMGVIGLVLAIMVPALGTGSGRALEGDARQFMAHLENARQIAIAERTRTRILIPVAQEAPPLAENLPLRAYTTASLDKTAGTWKQRDKWQRLSQSVAFNKNVGHLSQSVPEETVLTGTNKHSGTYIEFHANGSTSLDPTTALQVIELADAIADNAGTFTPRNTNLRLRVTIDPLTGIATLR